MRLSATLRRDDGSLLSALVVDLSLGGAGVELREALPIGAALLLLTGLLPSVGPGSSWVTPARAATPAMVSCSSSVVASSATAASRIRVCVSSR